MAKTIVQPKGLSIMNVFSGIVWGLLIGLMGCQFHLAEMSGMAPCLFNPDGCVESPMSNNSQFPQELRVQTAQAANRADRTELVYVRSADYYAMHYAQPDSAPPEAIVTLEDGMVAILAGDAPTESPPTGVITPVYHLQPSGMLAVPTGRIWLRFAEGEPIAAHRAAIEAAGYTIETLPYAPHAAWVQARSGNIADALNQMAQLEALPKVEHVEPQLLMQRSLR